MSSLSLETCLPNLESVALCAEMLSTRGQNFGLGLGLSLKHLALDWPRAAAKEPAAKKRQSNLFADYNHTMQRLCLMMQHQNNFIAALLSSTMNPSTEQPHLHI